MSGDADGTASVLEALQRHLDAAAGHREMAILLLTCPTIERIDAAWGYPAGDAVRQRIGALLAADVLREGDFLGQPCRGQFVLALGGAREAALAELAADKALRALASPFFAEDDEIFATATVGIALLPEHGDDAARLMQRAASASLAAQAGKGRAAIYAAQPAAAQTAEFLDQCRLRSAVADDALDLLFQPLYDLQLGQMMGAECQLCWPSETPVKVPADAAFAAAEAADLVPPMVSSILNRALRNVSDFRYRAGVDLRLQWHLPARALRCEALPELVQSALATWRLRPGRLCLGIGDLAQILDDVVLQQALVRLKAVGVRLALDDPKVPLATLFSLRALPFQEIRLDLVPVGSIAEGSPAERVLESTVSLARSLRLDVCALQPADEITLERLKAAGCHYVQGEIKGPALRAQDFITRYGFTE